MGKEEIYKKCEEIIELFNTHECWVCKETISADELCISTGIKYYHFDCAIVNGLIRNSKREIVYKSKCSQCYHETTHVVLRNYNREMIACILCGQMKEWTKKLF